MVFMLRSDNYERFVSEYGYSSSAPVGACMIADFIRNTITGGSGCNDVFPELLISVSGGNTVLRTNYLIRSRTEGGDMAEIIADNDFLGLTALELIRTIQFPGLAQIPAPDEDIIRYTGAAAISTALRTGILTTGADSPSETRYLTVPAYTDRSPSEFPPAAKNIMNSLLYMIYVSCIDGEETKKKREEKSLKKLFRPVLELATRKALAAYTYAEALTLAAAGLYLIK